MLARWLRNTVLLWESTQVELRGLYSTQRLQAFHGYTDETSLLRAILVLVATPLPCLAVTTLVDCVNLRPWSEGLQANGLFVGRELFTFWLFGFLATDQFRHSLSSLPLSTPRAFVNAGIVAVLTIGFLYGVGLVVGFPVPFTIVTGAPVWIALLSLSMAIPWARMIHADLELWQLMANTLKVWMCQVGLVVIYPTYFYIFTIVPEAAKTPFTFLLPAMKIVLRNIFARTVVHLHDEMPEVIVFNVEVFNALFLAYAMQNSPSMWTTAGLMAMDLVQLTAALRDISLILDELQALENKLGSGSTRQALEQLGGEPYVIQRETTIVERAVAFLMQRKATARVACGSSSTVAGPQEHLGSENVETEKDGCLLNSEQKIEVKPISGPAELSSIPSAPTSKSNLSLSKVAAADHNIYRVEDHESQLEARYLRNVQKLLYITEFVALINFVEVIIPLCPVRAVPRGLLPRHAGCFPGHLGLDTEDPMLKTRFRLSPIQQLAFAVEKQWDQVQVKLVIGVYYNVQVSLDHLEGYDNTFQFEWRHAVKMPLEEASRNL